MRDQTRSPWSKISVVVLAFFAAFIALPSFAADSAPIHIGISKSLLGPARASLIHLMAKPFRSLMEAQTGLSGRLVAAGDALHLGGWVNEGDVDLGIFQGVEFAWAQQKYPDLRPLMIAVYGSPDLRAYLVVRGDSPLTDVQALRGHKLSLPADCRLHCHLFLERQCRLCGEPDAKQFFSEIVTPAQGELALDDVVDRTVPVALVDRVCLDRYTHRKPQRAAELRVLRQSMSFPASVIAYRSGHLSQDTLLRFQRGMINAKQDPLGRQLLMLWKLTGFETVPANYEQTVHSVLRTFPHADPLPSTVTTTATQSASARK